jgi:hypothetical protein
MKNASRARREAAIGGIVIAAAALLLGLTVAVLYFGNALR